MPIAGWSGLDIAARTRIAVFRGTLISGDLPPDQLKIRLDQMATTARP